MSLDVHAHDFLPLRPPPAPKEAVQQGRAKFLTATEQRSSTLPEFVFTISATTTVYHYYKAHGNAFGKHIMIDWQDYFLKTPRKLQRRKSGKHLHSWRKWATSSTFLHSGSINNLAYYVHGKAHRSVPCVGGQHCGSACAV